MQYFGFDRPSFAFKTYGFGESSPKLQADFTIGTYKADGASKTFADLFTFSRAGAAWLIEDNKIKEYLADIPRVSTTGLLIEDESTNILPSTEHWFIRDGVIRTKKTDGITFNIGTSSDGLVYTYPNYNLETIYQMTVWAYSPNPIEFIITSQSTGQTIYSTDNKISKASKMLFRSVGAGQTHIGFFSQTEDITVVAAQLELGERVTTPIITDTTPVTRPADYLLNKITGTTVTGDWDSTLNLSIVAGNLVHSGYGRIRSLEIN